MRQIIFEAGPALLKKLNRGKRSVSPRKRKKGVVDNRKLHSKPRELGNRST